jgi:hypothetical protein
MYRYTDSYTCDSLEVSVPSNVVKLKPDTYERVRAKAQEQGASMQDIITRGIDALDRLEFAGAFRQDYEAIRADADAWQHEASERQIWESTLADGLVS